MAEKLEVSRPSVREAYCVLEIVGILESKVGSGTYVKSGDIDQISINKIRDISTQEESPYEILEVRKIIEPEIVAHAVGNASETNIREIGEILQRMKAEIQEDGIYSLEIDSKFHMKIAEATGNFVMVNMMKYIMNLIHERLWKSIVDEPDVLKDDLIHDIEFHENIFNCIKTRDVQGVRSVMIRRFNEIQKRIVG